MNRHKALNPIKFSMDDYDALPRTKRQLLANAPISLAIKNGRELTVERTQQLINQKMTKLTLRDYGPDHPDVGRNYYPREHKGINLEKINISL